MSKRKTVLLLIAVLVAFGMLSVSGFNQGVQAATTDTSTPSVTVTPGGSITVTPTGMSYGSQAAGTHIAYNDGSGHKVAITVTTNTTQWNVKCSKSQDLTSGGNTIASANFIYSSVYVSGTPTTPVVYTNQEFGSVGSPSNVAATPTTPAAADTLVVDVRYDLTLIPTQAAASSYQATHTYTLTAS
jgi:hypothetical protein